MSRSLDTPTVRSGRFISAGGGTDVTRPGNTYEFFNTSGSPLALALQSTGTIFDLASTTPAFWDIRYDGATAGDWLGAGGLQLVDINNDNQEDILVSAWGASIHGSQSGSVYLILYFPHTISIDSFRSSAGVPLRISGQVLAPNNPTTIAAVEWSPTGTPGGSDWQDCDPEDGTFNSNSERFLCTPGLLAPRTIYIRAEDTKGIYTNLTNYAQATLSLPPIPNVIVGTSQGGGGGSGYTPPYVPPAPPTLPASISTGTALSLQTQITFLLAQVKNLEAQLTAQGSAIILSNNACPNFLAFTFTRDLTLGSTGTDVQCLQQFLNNRGAVLAASGAGAPGHETNLFSSRTQAALAKWQASNSISPAVGYFGPITRPKVNAAIRFAYSTASGAR